jgi:hypothetical protein
MYRVIKILGAVALAGAAFAATAASAETRLFSVRTDQPGVTVVGAARNGVELPVAGQNAGATFFRLDNPAGAVPCSNQLRFTASNGRSVDAPVDLCAKNWELTVAVGAAGGNVAGNTDGNVAGNIGATAASASTGNGHQPLTVATDAPDVTITNVFLRGQEVPIAARQDPYVQINLLGGAQGFECSRDLGLALSDGRRIARVVDVCAANFLVVVPLVGGPRPAAPPASFRPPAVIQPLPQAPSPPVAQQPEAPPATPDPTGPEVVSNLQWLFSATGNRASFAYGIPETDASEITAVCGVRSSKVTVTLTRSADELGPKGTVPVTFGAGAFAKTYTATGSVVSDVDGISHPVLQIAVNDPLWAALIKGRVLAITIGSSAPYGLSLSGSAVPAKQFLAACAPAPPPPPPPSILPTPAPGPVSAAMGFVCDDGSSINVAFDAQTAVVYEPGTPPVVLFSARSAGGQRWVAGLSELVGEGENIYWTREGDYARTCQRG